MAKRLGSMVSYIHIIGFHWFVLGLWLGLSTLTDLTVTSHTLIESLPGYTGVLPFKLETGYIGVGEDEVVQLFYYFVESERNPEEDPLIIWLDGGPGASSIYGFFYEIGPMQFDYGEYEDDIPRLKLDPNSWTKLANVVYLDAPTNTGFSYTKTSNIVASDTLSASHTTEFIRKFVKDHPTFSNNSMYVSGMSYSGVVVPIITEEIFKGNDAGLKPTINIKGYMIGNPVTNQRVGLNSKFEYAYHMALISYDLFESAKKNCHEEYVDVDPNNVLCMISIEEVNKRIMRINPYQILEAKCAPQKSSILNAKNRTSVGYKPIRMLRARTSLKGFFCRDDHYPYVEIWANNKKVIKALNIREGTIKEWSLHNLDMAYTYEGVRSAYNFNVRNNVIYHRNLTKRDCRALVYSGDHDLVVPYTSTHGWILSLNLSITHNNWDAWYVNDQVAGYKITYARDNYSLAFTTVKGAGHTSPEYKPEECFQMVKRWLAFSLI